MALELSTMISNVRDNVQDPNALRWSDTLITQYLNDGQRKLAPNAFTLRRWVIPISRGLDSAFRPVDLLAPQELFFNIGDDQWPLTLRHGIPEDPVTIQGDPTAVYIVAANIYLRPVPTAAGNLIISGNARPSDMADSSDTPSLEDSEDAIVAYATYRCYVSDSDPVNSGLWQQIWKQERLEWVIQDAQKNPQRSRIERTWIFDDYAY